jgi:16S rRNA (cytosine1402-N4)-methyltransferase
LKNHLRANGIQQVDGILADLGVSSFQFNEEGKRGFSIRFNDPLDMRMNRSQKVSAKDVVNTYSEEDLARVFGKYGEVERPMRIAVEICKVRSKQPLATTFDLIETVKKFAPRNKEQKFYAQLFQAIRIEVNNEMDVLEKFLTQAAEVLKPEGRLVIMSYHSLEDRLVKNFMKRGNLDGSIEKDFFGNILKPFDEITRKPIVSTAEELELNPRARSAKLRIAVKR